MIYQSWKRRDHLDYDELRREALAGAPISIILNNATLSRGIDEIAKSPGFVRIELDIEKFPATAVSRLCEFSGHLEIGPIKKLSIFIVRNLILRHGLTVITGAVEEVSHWAAQLALLSANIRFSNPHTAEYIRHVATGRNLDADSIRGFIGDSANIREVVKNIRPEASQNQIDHGGKRMSPQNIREDKRMIDPEDEVPF